MNTEVKSSAVMSCLDKEAGFTEENFPYLGNGFYYVDSRFSVYRNDHHWSILIEVIEVNPQSTGHGRNHNRVYIYGNATQNTNYIVKNQFIPITHDSDPNSPTFWEYKGSDSDWVRPDTKSILVRGHEVLIPQDGYSYQPDVYEINSLPVPSIGELQPQHLLRALTPRHRDLFFLSGAEKQGLFTVSMNRLMQIEEWCHPVVHDDGTREMPSDSECFQLIASVIEAGTADLYLPTDLPNTHWKHCLVADKYV